MDALNFLPEGAIPLLVLTRRKSEEVVIGDNIVIKVIDIIGDRVRLGIEAPREVAVHRRENFDEIQRNHDAEKEGEKAD